MKIIAALIFGLFCTGCVQVSVTPSIDGVVRDSDTDAPIAGAAITMRHYQREDLKSEAVSGTDGTFHMSPIAIWMPIGSGAFRVAAKIEVRKEGYEPLEREFLHTEKTDLHLVRKRPIKSSTAQRP